MSINDEQNVLLFRSARSGAFELLSMKKFEVCDSFSKQDFPKVLYVIRSESGEEHFKSSNKLIQDWNSGDVIEHEFISRRSGIISAVTDGNKLGLKFGIDYI